MCHVRTRRRSERVNDALAAVHPCRPSASSVSTDCYVTCTIPACRTTLPVGRHVQHYRIEMAESPSVRHEPGLSVMSLSAGSCGSKPPSLSETQAKSPSARQSIKTSENRRLARRAAKEPSGLLPLGTLPLKGGFSTPRKV